MEKKLFIALNLQYMTMNKLLLLLCIIGVIEGIILLWYMHYKKKYYVSLPEFFWVFLCTPGFIYVLFIIERLTFFSCIFYTQLFLYILYCMTKQYKIADMHETKEKEKEKEKNEG